MENTVRQLNLFFDDVKTRVRVNDTCQFKQGDRFLDYVTLDDSYKPSVIEILSKKKHYKPGVTIEYTRRGETGRRRITAENATSHVDSGKWVQLDFQP